MHATDTVVGVDTRKARGVSNDMAGVQVSEVDCMIRVEHWALEGCMEYRESNLRSNKG